MNFHLNYLPHKSEKQISHKEKILMIGSCFAENVGEYLKDYKFNCLLNPSGILFNPISISNALNSFLDQSLLSEECLVQSENTFYSLFHHGDFNAVSKNDLLKLIKEATIRAHHYLKKSNWLIITFGSAFVYRHQLTNLIVANCHKLPQNQFRKELLKVQEITEEYNVLIQKLNSFNPDLNLIFTVSPVKYLRDGVIENNLSKAILIQGVHEIISTHKNCFYFPSYELVNDDLRDYRFYKEDLAHPNEQAIKYIWDKFSETYFSEETRILNKKIEDILNAAAHRPINSSSPNHLQFKANFLKRCEEMEKKSGLNFNKEKALFHP